jgi:hypothetical protein
MEKSNQKKKVITEIIENNTLYSDPINVNKKIRNYFSILYQTQKLDEEKQELFLNNITNHLNNEDNALLNVTLTQEELLNAAKSLGKGKSPGIDGIPVEFYHKYWDKIGSLFTELTNENLFQENRELTWSQRTAILSLLPKEGDLKLLKNWRPISLLCADYKIMTKALANRLAKSLEKILESSQTCSVPNRSIFSNLFLVRDLIEYTNQKNSQGFILSIDQEKAFDKLDRNFLYKVLQRFNLGSNFILAIKQSLKNTQSIVINNGFMSQPFQISRGVRQGDPISLMLYCIAVETLSLSIKKNKKIDGIPLPGTKQNLKILQYADDTIITAKNITSIDETFKILEDFRQASGSNINKLKSKALALGHFNYLAYQNYTKKGYYPDHSIKWINQTGLKILGV